MTDEIDIFVALARRCALTPSREVEEPRVVRIRNGAGHLIGMFTHDPSGKITYGEVAAPGRRIVIGKFWPHNPGTHQRDRERLKAAIVAAREDRPR